MQIYMGKSFKNVDFATKIGVLILYKLKIIRKITSNIKKFQKWIFLSMSKNTQNTMVNELVYGVRCMME